MDTDNSGVKRGQRYTENQSPWKLLVGLLLGIATVANTFGAFYWGYSFMPPLLLGSALYLPRRTRMVGLGSLAASLGLFSFSVSESLLVLTLN